MIIMTIITLTVFNISQRFQSSSGGQGVSAVHPLLVNLLYFTVQASFLWGTIAQWLEHWTQSRDNFIPVHSAV